MVKETKTGGSRRPARENNMWHINGHVWCFRADFYESTHAHPVHLGRSATPAILFTRICPNRSALAIVSRRKYPDVWVVFTWSKCESRKGLPRALGPFERAALSSLTLLYFIDSFFISFNITSPNMRIRVCKHDTSPSKEGYTAFKCSSAIALNVFL